MTSPRVICVGEGLIVLVAEPGPLENSETFHRSAGGAEANVARVLVQLGVSTAWISRVGDDGFGRYLVSQLNDAGVETSSVSIDPCRSTGVYVKERGAGTGAGWDLPRGESRMTYLRAGSAASGLSCSDIAEGLAAELIRDADLVHVTGITVALSDTAEQMTRALVAGEAMVSFDLNYRPALWRERVSDAPGILADHVRGSDIVLMGADEANDVFGIDDPDELRAEFPEPRHLVIKNNSHSVTAFDGETRVVVPGLTVEVIEKIGAGDAFAGGYLAGLLTGLAIVDRVRLGHLCAAAALTAHGDIATILDRSSRAAALALSEREWHGVDYHRLVSA